MAAAEQLARIRAHFEVAGKRRPRIDLMIAAQAVAAGLVHEIELPVAASPPVLAVSTASGAFGPGYIPLQVRNGWH